jgi:acyl-CoA thioester hydrolase
MENAHRLQLRVRYDECDPMGFVHHANYMKYFEIARTDLYRSQGGSYRAFEESGLYVVVAKIECQYHAPARYDDLLDIYVRIERITEAKIEQSYRVERDGERIVSGAVKLAVIDSSGKLQRIPASLKDPLSKMEAASDPNNE